MLGQLLKHTSNYALGNVLMVLAGLVSFPVLTRILSVSDYGVMSLVAVALTLVVAVGKLGMQHASLRFYSEIAAGKRQLDFQVFVSTAILAAMVSGLVATLLWLVANWLVPFDWWGDDPRVRLLMMFTAGLIFVRVLDSAFVNQLRAQERSGVLTLYGVARRYVLLVVVLAVLVFWAPNVWGFFSATIFSEVLATLMLGGWLLRQYPIRLRSFSPELSRAMLAFGLPMIGYELSSVALSMGDRYIIQKLLGAEQLGVYSAAYSLCEYIKAGVFASMVAAAQPMYMRLWEKEGALVTTAFLQRFTTLYVMVSMLVVGGLAAVGSDVLALLASQKYRPGQVVLPWLMASMAIESVVVITGAGLYIQKRSKTIMWLVFSSAVLNFGLNFLLLPRLGLVAAGVASLCGCLWLMLLGLRLGRGVLPWPIPWLSFLKFGVIAAVMCAVVMQVHLPHLVWQLGARVVLGGLIYGALTLAFDRQARQDAAQLLEKLRRRVAGRPR